ncbi:MAG TPA: hypothetical protein VMJ72_01215 [Candidatus Paceibacterota bacterium]|nr:hypothetical protein [Candidatus Paceibacterota bacterium]
MKRVWMLLVLMCAACAPGSQMPTSPSAVSPSPWPSPWPKHERANVYVLIHLWYQATPDRCSTAGPPAPQWGPWVWSGKTDDPCQTIPGAPWLRDISSAAYPLIGPYDSGSDDVLRWQIHQAQAAGIDGFFASVYSWAPNLRFVFDRFFGNDEQHLKGLLQIAHEEHFHVALEGWGLTTPEDLATQKEPWKAEVARHLAAIQSSPYRDAYITIGGKPAYWLIYPDWMTDSERMTFFDGTADDPRTVTWVIRDGLIGHTIELDRRLMNAKAQYPSWSDVPTPSGWNFSPLFVSDLTTERSYENLGMIPTAHAYAGFEERVGKQPTPGFGRYGLRNGITLIADFLERAVTNGAQMIFIESWNEWGEGSMIEAGTNISKWRDEGQERNLYQDAQGNDDPYEYLDVFRKFNGMQEWVPPQPPPCSAVDPLIRLRNQSDPHSAVPCQ